MKIKSITKVKPRTVYALETSTHTFVADGLAHHNCPHCNLHLSGNPIAYNKFIIDTYGIDTFNQMTDTYLKWKAGKIPAFKMSELRDIYDEWLAEGRKLEKKTGLELFPKTWLPFGPDFIK